MMFRPIPGLAEARAESSPAERLKKLRRAAAKAKEAIENEGPVAAVASCPLVTFPYPTGYAFSGGALSPAPYVMMTNRMHVVQFLDDRGERRTLLFNPTDYERSIRAPFYWTLKQRYGEFLSNKVFKKKHGSVEGHLARLGLRPEDVDYIAFDHLHVQDLRGWLGGDGGAFFPRAKLIVHDAEWESVTNLHPFNYAWYVPDGTKGVPEERLVRLGGDAWLGRGCAIVATPGHTMGNMSLVLVTADRGTFVISENGVATESYTPLASAIPGVRGFAEQFGYEVVLNGNTREHSLEQYTSMVVEKTLAGPSKVDPTYVNFLPSSELTASVMAPALSPTFSHGEVNHGEIQKPKGLRAVA